MIKLDDVGDHLSILGHHAMSNLCLLSILVHCQLQLRNTEKQKRLEPHIYHLIIVPPVKQFCQVLGHFGWIVPIGEDVKQVGRGGKVEPLRSVKKAGNFQTHLGKASLFVSRYSARAFSHLIRLFCRS